MSCGLPSPGAAEDFTLDSVSRNDVPHWYHVYSPGAHAITAMSFNPGFGNTRFAPITQPSGDMVHTYYIASNIEAVLMESLLHDVELSPPGAFEVASLDRSYLVTLELPDPVEFVSFHSAFLPKLGLNRTQLIDSDPDCYPETRRWSTAAFAQRSTAQAVAYTSRIHDIGRCMMLFGQRMPTPPFIVLADQNIGGTPALRARALKLVRSLKLHES